MNKSVGSISQIVSTHQRTQRSNSSSSSYECSECKLKQNQEPGNYANEADDENLEESKQPDNQSIKIPLNKQRSPPPNVCDKRALFRAFKRFYAQGIYADPKYFISKKKDKIRIRSKRVETIQQTIIRSKVFSDFLPLLTNDDIEQLSKRIKLCKATPAVYKSQRRMSSNQSLII